MKPPPICSWKENWPLSRQRFLKWWQQEANLVGQWNPPAQDRLHEPDYNDPGLLPDLWKRQIEAVWRAQSMHYSINRQCLRLDFLPIAGPALGPGSLATMLGCEPELSSGSVWYRHRWEDVADPESCPPLCFDPQDKWFLKHAELLREAKRLGAGKYFIGIQDLIENIDILASLRGNVNMLMDLIERPEWAHQKLKEINQVWFEAYDRLYEIVREPDGSSVFWAFMVWSPGKAAKLQCDACSMISPEMFDEFIVPRLREQCEYVDHSMYHLDGKECLDKLDSLLAIDALDAIEWTPDPKSLPGTDPSWYPMYRRILEAGKSVQIISVAPEKVVRLFDDLGDKGLYLLCDFTSARQAESVEAELNRRFNYAV